MKGPKFYNKSGELNAYGLACGYVEQFKNEATGFYVQMYMEHEHFHVQLVDNEHGYTSEWLTFSPCELTKARKALKLLQKRIR